MNTESMNYFVELTKDFHITNTANRLFISQQTLSNHIARLEKEMGVQLLYRQPNQGLTPAGEVFLAYCRSVLAEQESLREQMSSIKLEESGVIRFGASHFRMSNSLHHVLNAFHARYPLVQFDLVENSAVNLEEMTSGGQLTFSIVLAADTHPNLVAHHLLMDQTYVCVSDTLLRQHYTPAECTALKRKMLHGVEISDISRLPFCLFRNRMGMQIDMCFQAAKLKPNVFLYSTHLSIAMHVCKNDLAACFSTQMALAEAGSDMSRINTFPLLQQGKPLSQKLVILYQKNRYLPAYSKCLLDMLLQHFEQLERRNFTHIAEE